MGGTQWYSPSRVISAWSYIIKFLDKTFKDCDIVYGKKLGYDLSQHTVFIKRHTKFNKLELIGSMIEMILRNLVPGTQNAIYKEEQYLMVPLKNIDQMAGRIAEKVYPRFDRNVEGGWLNYIDQKHKPKKKPKLPHVNKTDLAYMYYDRKLTCKQIADLLKVDRETVRQLLEKYDLPRRPRGGKIYIAPEKLDDLYYNQDFTIRELAKIFEVSTKTIMGKMKEYNFPLRNKAYTVPVWMNRVRAFKSSLRKKFRRNKVYIEITQDVVNEARKDPDLREFDKDVKNIEKYENHFEKD